MSGPPPEDLMKWRKQDLAREVARLRDLLSEHADNPGHDPRQYASDGDSVVNVAGDPHAIGGVLLNVKNAVLLDTVDVSLIDSHSTTNGMPVAFLVLSGRVNYATDRVEHTYLFNADGAAGIVTELIGLAERSSGHAETVGYGIEFMNAFNRRRAELP